MNTYPKVSRIPKAEEVDLINAARQGCQKSRDYLVLSNISVVVWAANKFKNGNWNMDDMVQEGVLGILKSIDTYRLINDCSFSTYCRFSVMDHIFKLITERQSAIKLGQTITKDIWKMNAVMEDYIYRLNRSPTDQEMADATGFTPYRITLLRKHSLCMDAESLDEFNEPGSDTDPLSHIQAEQLSEGIKRCLENINPRDQEVISRYFGLAPYDQMDMKTIGEEMGVGESRVSQICKSVIAKLSDDKSTQLPEYV